MGIIELEGMHFYACHGYFEAERIVGNEFVVDVSVETDCTLAAKTDKLEDALNYQRIFDVVKHEMNIPSYLLEHVANRILESLLRELPSAEKLKVKVTKLNPSMGGQVEKASILLSRQK